MLRFCKKTNISNSEKEKKRTDNQDCSDKNEELGQKKMLEVKVKIEEKAEKDHAWRGWKIQSESLERDWVAGGSRGIHEIKPRSAEREREEESHFRARGDGALFLQKRSIKHTKHYAPRSKFHSTRCVVAKNHKYF